jgi:hypothetical protein
VPKRHISKRCNEYLTENMKYKIAIFSSLLSILTSFNLKDEIGKCFISFKSSTNLTPKTPDRLPDGAKKVRAIKTSSGEANITCMDGYQVLYLNAKNATFVNLKVELSDNRSYEEDQKGLIDNLKYLLAHSSGMEEDLVELEFNGFKIYGISRATMEQGSTLGMFVMFPGKDVVVYFYFNNLQPEFRNFTSVEDYKIQRDIFMNEYTKHLTSCKDR